MDLKLKNELGSNYESSRQKARVITEKWVLDNYKCPFCSGTLKPFSNNNKCSDFYCGKCNESFELKSKKGRFSKRISGAEYKTTVEKVSSNENPNWILLEHNGLFVTRLILLPKQFVYAEMVIPREPLGENARRTGWQGCILDLNKLPKFAQIEFIKNGSIIDQKIVNYRLKQAECFKKNNMKDKGWKLEVLACVDSLPGSIFSSSQMKQFFPLLKETHPNNNHIDKKVSQILQYLRDMNFIKFIDNNGLYMKLF